MAAYVEGVTMTIQLSSAVLYGDSQPDFSILLSKGWGHPLGLGDEPLLGSLIKTFGRLRFQIVRHEYHSLKAKWPTYTEIYVHDTAEEDMTTLKGHNTPFSTANLLAAIVWLEQELEG